MKRINKVQPIVLQILEEVPDSRNSDRVLLQEFYKRIGADINRPFSQIVMDFNLPPFESVRRSRQKVQHDHPDLKPDEKVESYRILNEETVRNWAVGKAQI